ncbi:MAG: type II toxin-antitoxin system VapC family toxin [Methanospirillaceae archaeon]|nr:type II toxin-antitoxin system VapC family toxin [Methanospirillaceae archaeon]
MKSTILFDTHALMTLWNNDPGAEIIQNLLKKVDDSMIQGCISVISLTEVYYLTCRVLGNDNARSLTEKILCSSLRIIPVSSEIAIVAGMIKQKEISLADTIIVASAKQVNATVISGDPHFRELGVDLFTYP